jgi:hypothetical protein
VEEADLSAGRSGHACLALPFAYMQDRMGAVSIRVFAGIMLGIGFHMLNGLVFQPGRHQQLGPISFRRSRPACFSSLRGRGHALVGGATLSVMTDLNIRRVPARRSCRKLVIAVEQGPEQANAETRAVLGHASDIAQNQKTIDREGGFAI